MNKANLLLPTTLFAAMAGCSTQQTSQQVQVAQNTPQSQGIVASPAVKKDIKPVAQVRTAVSKPKPTATRPVKAVPVRAKPATATRATSAMMKAPRVQTIKKPAPVPTAKQTPWQRRQAVMNRMASWRMGGRAALRFKGDAWTFGLNWLQRNRQQYSLQIRNPITGTVVGILDQSPGRATLRSRGKTHTGPDAERLLQQQLGVKMPVNGMPYWIRGVMAPQYPAGKVNLDAKGRPRQIVQAGWVIDYFNYQSLSFDALPSKVNIARQQERVNVRILAKQWQKR